MRLKLGTILLGLLLALPQPARAQQAEPRTLAVPATSAWQHAGSGMILRAESAGLRRGSIRDGTAEELDVSADYQDPAGGVTATVYIFRAGEPDAAIWFDRALFAIGAQPRFGLDPAALPVPTAFARPGASVSAGLRAAMDTHGPDAASTAVALAPIGPWLVKIRLSAARLDRAALDALMSRFIDALGWPAAGAADRAAVPIQPCATPLTFRQARIVRSEGADVLMDLIAGAVTAEHDDLPAPVYCREPGPTVQYGVYRPNESRDAYLLALGDAGIALTVGESGMAGLLDGDRSRRYGMMLLDRDTTSALPAFNRLPSPAQAVSVAFGARSEPTMSVSVSDRH